MKLHHLIVLSLITVRFTSTAQNSFPATGTTILNSGTDQSLIIRDGRSGTNWNYLEWQFIDGSRDWVLGRRVATGYFTLWRNGVNEVLTVDNSGSLGVGITSPTSRLHINGDFRMSGLSRKIVVGSEGAPSDYLLLQDVGADGAAVQWVHDGAPKFSIQGVTGNVGIGTINPTARMEINATAGSSGQNEVLRLWGGNTSNYFGNAQLALSFGGGGGGYTHQIKSRHNSSAISGNAIDFFLWQPGDAVNNPGSLNVMSLNGDKVGIGTSSPSAKLEINETAAEIPAFKISDFTIVPQLLNGSWNPISKNGDLGIILKNGRSLVIGPHSSTSGGIRIGADGNVGIGTGSPNQKLTVNGTIYGKEVKVDLNVPGPDYVFEKDYKLPTLDEIKSYIDANKHLPEVPSAKEMEEKGINLSEMNMLLLKKVEELTLHLIEQNKEIIELRSEVKNLKNKIND